MNKFKRISPLSIFLISHIATFTLYSQLSPTDQAPFGSVIDERGTLRKHIIAKFLPKNAVLLEAGAHKGIDTVEWAQALPNGQIHAFEPIPELFELVKEKTKKFKNVHCYRYALSNKNDTATLNISNNDGASSSLLKPRLDSKGRWATWSQFAFETTITVPTITIDKWMEENSIEKIDAMWLDLQGFEKQVLEASPKAFASVKVIYTEASHIPSYHGVVLFPEYRTWLEKHGFTMKWFRTPYGAETDALFVRE